ncbi:amidohydrolase [Jannaschia sp. W003]|uniref:amidohydrolase family protein n=1 Tax=Jannaschia sp. W003 TaxID=2867012 RepID=UPI0021A35C6A|nr:amidohydrolase family protein [Jannaschia sp. W003]UWQ20178.1 amidohydrolase family protein [Jannaschia sp. W003]
MIPRSAPPIPAGTPARPLPPGACDTHIHMLGSDAEFPPYEGRVEGPAEGLGFVDYLAAYRAQAGALGIERTVVVQSILYGTDNAVTLRAVEALGRDAARAVVLVPDGAGAETLDPLAAAGAVGVRLNYVHGGVLGWDGVEAMAPLLAERGMHVQMLAMAERHIAELAPRIAALPVPVVLDHMAWPDVAAGVDAPGFRALCRLLAEGHAWVKLSAPFRLAAAPFEALDEHVGALLRANPERCLWGSDWPQIMLGGAERCGAGALLDAFDLACPDDATRRMVLCENPARLYGF